MSKLAFVFVALAATAAPEPERLDKEEALRQLAAHSCFVRLAADALQDELEACVDAFPQDVVVDDDDGRCARYGVLGERLLFCQHALVTWQQAQLTQDAPAQLEALLRVYARCQARELCPKPGLKGASFRRPSPPPSRRP